MRKLSKFDFKWRDTRKHRFFKNVVFRAFLLFVPLIAFRNNLGTHNKGTLFAQEEQRSANFGTIWSVISKLEHKVPFRFSQKEQLVPLLSFQEQKVLFQQFRFPFMFLSKWLGNKCSQSNFLLYTVRNKLFLFTGISTAVRNALFPFGSNCSYSCPTGTELFLIEVVFCSSRWVLCSAYKWEQVPNLWQRN